MSLNIAMIGAGIMGSAIATRLLECGHKLYVFDLDNGKVAALVNKGAVAADTVSAATALADYVVLSLNHADIVRIAVFGADGIAASASPQKLLIDMSSIDPGATAMMATQLESSTGMAWVDCPLSGGVPGALAGKLTVMAGGSEANFERARHVMKDLCTNYNLMGGSGAGQTTKLVNQLFCALAFQAVAEAVKLGRSRWR